MSLGREDRAFHGYGGSIPTALKSAPAQAAEIICSLRDLGFEGQYLRLNDSVQLNSSGLQLVTLIISACVNVLCLTLGGWVHNPRLTGERVENVLFPNV